VNFDFLQLKHVLEIHENQISLYGGEYGVRDLNLLESAIATPRATFAGEFLHDGPFAIAAAYLFHIVQNHPFVDGNKRVGATAAIVFLKSNGIELHMDNESVVDLVLRVATGQLAKNEIAVILQRNSKMPE
jgi:death-on-curing protein